MASQMQIRSEPSPTQQEFNMDNTPSEYIGIEAPSDDPNDSARELFGLNTTPVSKDHQCQQQSNDASDSDGPLVPLYTPVTPFYGTIYGYPYPVANSSPSPLIAVPPPSHFIPPYLPSQYMHYLPNNQTGIVYGPTVGNQMMFGVGYNAPKFINENNLEVDTMETSNDGRDPKREDVNEDGGVSRHKQAPSTPTSHFAHGNGYAQKRLRLNDDASASPAHLADTEGKNVSVDAIVAQLLGQSNESVDGVRVHGLSDHEKEHYLQQFVGLVDLDNLFKSNQNSFNSSPCTPSEDTASSFEESTCDNSVRSSTVPRFESLLEINDQNIKCMQDGLIGNQGAQLDNSDIIYPQSPLCTEEIIVETYQG
jgi:hypothetical protein